MDQGAEMSLVAVESGKWMYAAIDGIIGSDALVKVKCCPRCLEDRRLIVLFKDSNGGVVTGGLDCERGEASHVTCSTTRDAR